MALSIKKYIKNRIWDYLICVGAALGLSFNIFSSFVMTDHLSASIPITLAVTAAAMLVVFIAAYNKKTTIIFLSIFTIAVIIAIIYFHKNNPFIGEGYDQSVNLFWIITILSAFAVFLLSRLKAGCIVLFVGGHIMIAAFAFLEYPVAFWGYILFLFCGIMAYFNRTYYAAAIKAHCGKISFRANFMQGAGMCILVLLAAAGIFQFIIKPLDLPTDNIKLYTKIVSLEVLERVGIYSTSEEADPGNTSNQAPDRTDYGSNQDNEEETEPVEEIQNTVDETAQNEEGINENDPGEAETKEAERITYHHKSYIKYIILSICIILIIALPFVLKKLLRDSWYKKVMRMEAAKGSMAVYIDILRKIRHAGYKKQKDLTLLEYADNNEKPFKNFAVSEITFKKLTEIYVGILYGKIQVTGREFDGFILFHRSLNKNIKKEIGFIKYALKYFIL